VPIEQVVKSNGQHLDVVIVGGDSVGGAQADAGRYGNARVVESHEIVFDFGCPVRRKGIFEARASQPVAVLLFEPLIELPLVTLLTVNWLPPSQLPPPLT
jgi:hypothetical protein